MFIFIEVNFSFCFLFCAFLRQENFTEITETNLWHWESIWQNTTMFFAFVSSWELQSKKTYRCSIGSCMWNSWTLCFRLTGKLLHTVHRAWEVKGPLRSPSWEERIIMIFYSCWLMPFFLLLGGYIHDFQVLFSILTRVNVNFWSK